MGDRAPRPPGDLPDRRRRAAGGPDPRDGQLLAPLGGGGAAARRPLHGRRPGPARPRRLGRGPRRLLARRPRLQHPRPADDDRNRTGHRRRPLARRWDRDAVLLPVPPAGRAACPDLERRPRPRGEPDAPRRRPARRGHRDLAGGQSAGPLGTRTRRRADAGARQPEGRLPGGGGARHAAPPGRSGPAGVRADAALGDRRARPARQRNRPALPARRAAHPARLGRSGTTRSRWSTAWPPTS